MGELKLLFYVVVDFAFEGLRGICFVNLLDAFGDSFCP